MAEPLDEQAPSAGADAATAEDMSYRYSRGMQMTAMSEAEAAAEPWPRHKAGTPERCPCGHHRSRHDRVATRWCQATVEDRLTRNCICPPSDETEDSPS
jgi:hypothetical protein